MVLFKCLSSCSSTQNVFHNRDLCWKAVSSPAGLANPADEMGCDEMSHSSLTTVRTVQGLPLLLMEIDEKNQKVVKSLTFYFVFSMKLDVCLIHVTPEPQCFCWNWCGNCSSRACPSLKAELCNVLRGIVSSTDSKIFWFSRTVLLGERTSQLPNHVMCNISTTLTSGV